ncbi:MAG: hypothetical protein WBI14_06560 [Anaerolineaceae bacterium]
MKRNKNTHFRAMFLIWAISLILSACQPKALPAEARATPTPTLANPVPILESTISQPILVTPTPNFDGNPIQVSEMQYFQQGTRLTVIAKLINTLNTNCVRDVQLEILALDATGTRIAQAKDEIKFIFPGETTGIVQQFDLQADVYTEKTEVRVNGGYIDQNNTYAQPFSHNIPTFFGGADVPVMTGWLLNRDSVTYTEVILNAIAYNSRGEIIGGGRSVIEFVPGEDRIGVSVPSSFIGQPEKVELYAWLGPHSAALEPGSWWNAIQVQDWNFVISPTNEVAGGAEWINATEQTLRKTWYVVTVYDDAGQVNLVNKGFIDTIWPKETLHFALPVIYAPSDSTPTHVDLMVVPGEFGQPALGYNPLRASQAIVEFSNDQPLGKVTVVNNLNARISDAIVMLTVQNSSGDFVGSGFVSTGPLDANSSAIITVPVFVIPPYEGLVTNASVLIPDGVKIGE